MKMTANFLAATSILLSSYFSASAGTVAALVTWGVAGSTNVPSGLSNVVAVAAGSEYDLCLMADGTVAAWGNNYDYFGGYEGEAVVPAGLSNVVAVASGGYDSLVLKSDGTVAVWGWNTTGQATVPSGLSNVVAVAGGWQHSLALKSDGTVVAWGDNSDGQSTVPPGLSNVIAIAAGRYHSLALKADGTMAAWGENLAPYVGYVGEATVPAGLSNVVAIAGQSYGSVALKSDGTVFDWGFDYDGSAEVPAGLSNVVAIAGGGEYGFALKSDGTLTGWGDNNFNELNFPDGTSNVLTVADGSANSIALTGVIAPQQVQPPMDITVAVGGSALFKAGILGSYPLSWQWQCNGTNVPSPNGSVLLLTNVQFSQAGQYWLLASNVNGGMQSSPAQLNVVPLIITAQPTNLLLYVGDSTVLSVAAQGAQPFSYQWSSNGVAIAGETNATFAMNNVTTNLTAGYAVTVSNLYGAVQSSIALISVVPLTAVVSPASQTVYGGDPATFSATAQKDGPFTFQWRFNGADLPGETNTSLSLANVTTNQSGFYSVRGTNSFGTAESSNATLTVVPITASAQPASQNLYVGDTATFSAVVQKNGPFTYQWRFNGTDIPDQTNSTLTLTGLTTNNAGNYAVQATNPYGVIESANATLTVTDSAPVIVSGPANLFTWVGNTASFSTTVNGSKPLNYQWSFNGVPLPDATNATLTLSPAATNQVGVYAVTISNLLGGGSASASLTLEPVVAWGQSSSGQTIFNRLTLTNTTVVSAGYNYSLALKSDGTVFSWGGISTLPAANSNLTAIAAGYSQSLALRSNGTVVAWGSGTLPVAPADLTNAAAIHVAKTSSSFTMNCFAIRSDSTLVGWNNSYGSSLTNIPAGLTGIIGVAAGTYHAMALKSDGSITAWQDYSDYGANVPPGNLSNVNNLVAIAAGFSHSLALKTDGTVVAWGNNAYGQTNVPAGLTNVIAIAAGGYHSVALKSDGTVVAWGQNTYGQTNVPAAYTNIIALNGGGYHTLALSGTGNPAIVRQPQSTTALINQPVLLSVGVVSKKSVSYQWLLNGAAIFDATNSSYRIASLGAANRGGYSIVVSNATGVVTSSVAQVNRTGNAVVAWGLNTSGQTNVPAGLNAIAIGGGNAHSIALRASGTVAAWGTSNFSVTNVPVNASNIIAISAGFTHNIVLNASRTVISWGSMTTPPANFTNFLALSSGYNYALGLSNGIVAVWGIANPPSSLSNAIAIFGGYSQALALNPDGSLTSWPSDPVAPAGLSNIVTLAAGNGFNLAVKTDGTVTAWGNNVYGQCNVPAGLSNIVAVAAGGCHSLALKSDGTAIGWGWNAYGQTNVPTDIGNIVAIAAGSYHSLAMVSSSDPTIIRQPAPLYTNVTGSILLSVGAVSSQPLTFQWLTNGTPIPGATNWWLDLPKPQTNNSGSYSVIVSNALGVLTSSNAAVSVLSRPPFFLTQPAGQTNIGGGSLTLSATVDGSAPLNYQWQKDGAAILNATNSTLLFNSLTRSNSGVYSLVVSNDFGVLTSSNAVLRVMVPQQLESPVINPDGSVAFVFGDCDGGLLSSNDPAHFAVSASTNLMDWQVLSDTPLLTNGMLLLQDFDATNFPQRFYRVIENP
jgi:alpha-tubulin suppressor-like RCC1 family protein